MLSLSLRDLQSGDGAAIPIAGRVSAVVLLVITLTVITACLSMSSPKSHTPHLKNISLMAWV